MKIKIFFTIFAIFLTAGCTRLQNTQSLKMQNPMQVIYNDNSLKEAGATSTYAERVLLYSTAIMLKRHELNLTGSQWQLKPYRLNQLYPICQDEPYAQESSLGFCTAVLISPKLVLTAGHCLPQGKDCENTAFMFDYFYSESSRVHTMDQVFFCKQILQREDTLRNGGADFALIELDRVVYNRQPVKIAKSRATNQQQIVIGGHPMGLPYKWESVKVHEIEAGPSNFFKVKSDTFGGSSGSPALDAKTGELIGILSRGEDDFDEDELYEARKGGSCVRYKRCADFSCKGERFYSIHQLVF